MASLPPASIFALYITFPASGYLHVETFPTAFDRALHVLTLAAAPVTLRLVNY